MATTVAENRDAAAMGVVLGARYVLKNYRAQSSPGEQRENLSREVFLPEIGGSSLCSACVCSWEVNSRCWKGWCTSRVGIGVVLVLVLLLYEL